MENNAREYLIKCFGWRKMKNKIKHSGDLTRRGEWVIWKRGLGWAGKLEIFTIFKIYSESLPKFIKNMLFKFFIFFYPFNSQYDFPLFLVPGRRASKTRSFVRLLSPSFPARFASCFFHDFVFLSSGFFRRAAKFRDEKKVSW